MSNQIIIREFEGDTIKVTLSMEHHPAAYVQKLSELVHKSGMTEIEAMTHLQQNPIVLELFYQEGIGLFAIDAKATEHCDIYNPFTGMIIPNENHPYIEPDPIRFLDNSINELTEMETDLRIMVCEKHDFTAENQDHYDAALESVREAIDHFNNINLTEEREILERESPEDYDFDDE